MKWTSLGRGLLAAAAFGLLSLNASARPAAGAGGSQAYEANLPPDLATAPDMCALVPCKDVFPGATSFSQRKGQPPYVEALGGPDGKQVLGYVMLSTDITDHTTPDPVTLHALIARMAEAGCSHVFMEVSSHAVDQQRIAGLHYAAGVFTNLTRDHLDYHKTVDNYLRAKKRFFDTLPAEAFALTNADDKSGAVMLQNTAARKLTYSLRTAADFKGKIVEAHFEGTELLIDGRDVTVAFVGRFNAYNLLAVYGTAVALGEDAEQVLVALSSLRPVAGRFETITSPEGFTAIVDYAHTPDALANVLTSIHEVLRGTGRVITVVGAGGNRDTGKRPLMAREADRQSDQLILTSDNPRFEDPDAIIREMEAGLDTAARVRVLCITDRLSAIKTACRLARRGDVVLVAGKGHEDYQEVRGVKHPFDDREVLRTLFSTSKA